MPDLSFQLLVALVCGAPNMLSHDLLMAAVWPGLVVNLETVNKRAILLREALGDDSKEPRYIAAVRSRGYRLVAGVTRVKRAAVPLEAEVASPVVEGGSIYSPINSSYAGIEYDAESGAVLGNFAASEPPAVTDATAVFLSGSTLQGIRRSDHTILWSFAGDGVLSTSPVIVNNFVFVGSANGNLYALDLTSGSQVWTQALVDPIAGNPCCSYQIYTGLAAADALFVVPSGNKVTTYLLSSSP